MQPRKFLPLVFLLVAGCGSGHVPVAGQVVFEDDQPARELSGGTVVFESIDVTPKFSARGAIDGEGRFNLGTTKPGDGVPPGKYRAMVSPPLTVELDESRGTLPPPLDDRFQRFESSGLEFEIGAGKNDITVKVSRPAQ
ncbi:MAG: hypothetical protein AB7K24_25665 [Gemmataceae bacterium]